jgi:uracil-DNA glycosylase
VRCAPPDNKPTPDEIANCSRYLDAEWKLLKRKRVLLALGRIGFDAALAMAARNGCQVPVPRRPFGHGAAVRLGEVTLIGSYHVSQQNTFTGKLTPRMFDKVLEQCRKAQRSKEAQISS